MRINRNLGKRPWPTDTMNKLQIVNRKLILIFHLALAVSGCADTTSSSKQSPDRLALSTPMPEPPPPTFALNQNANANANVNLPIPTLPIPTQTPEQTESVVSAYLRSRVTSESEGALSLSSFRKTNGYEKDYGTYVIEWQGEISVLRDLWKGDNFTLGLGYFQNFFVRPDTERLYGQEPLNFFKGARIALTGDSLLRKTEKGWRLEKLKIKTEQVLTKSKVEAEKKGSANR